MDVLVCGAQAVFMRGGAEIMQENLVAALREHGHRAEIVRMPVAWEKGRIFDAATAWRSVPMDADLVIPINFPAYYVRHPRKVPWLAHQHRGAYDNIDAPWSDFGPDEDSTEIQRLLTEWDCRVLGEAERIYTISQVVADRLTRYNGLSGTALYHPPHLAGDLRGGTQGDYLFCPLRLEQNKRPDRVVSALPRTGRLRAVVAGTGSLREQLMAQADRAGVRDRVDLPGYVEDHQLLDLFADCLAVVYAPYDEDYGYVALQAFLAGKPVITSADSGGVLEWVEDGVTGLVTDGSPEQLADAAARLDADRALAAALGSAGRTRVADLSWSQVVTTLLGS